MIARMTGQSEWRKERRPTEQEMQEVVEKMVLEKLEEISREIDGELAGGYGNDIPRATQSNHADPQGKKRN